MKLGSMLVLAAALAGAGCSTMPTAQCAAGERGMVSDHLYFGTAKPQGTVSPAEWAEFLGRAVTPAFPKGLTAWPASGQWKGADGAIVHESSYVLQLIHPGDETSERAIRAAMEDYKARFQQEAVMRIRERACISF